MIKAARRTDQGGGASNGEDTWDATAADADTSRGGGRHGAEKREMVGGAGWWEKPASESYGVEVREGGHEASGVEENPRGYCQIVGGGF